VHTRHSPAMRLGWFGPIHAGEFERAKKLFRKVVSTNVVISIMPLTLQ